MLLLLQVATNQTAPLFSNDIVGFMKITSLLLVVVLLPIAGLVIYFLKQGPHLEIAAVRGEVVTIRADVNGFGGRMNAQEQRHSALEERVNGVYSAIAESQRDIMGAIAASSRAQTDATHALALEVTRLQERSDIGHDLAEGLAKFGQSIDRLADAVVRQTPVRGD